MKTVKSPIPDKSLNRQRHPMWIFPATYTYYDVICEAEFQFQQVEWIEDFGIFKKGEKCDYIVVSFEGGFIKEYDIDHMTRVMEFTARPVSK